MGRRGIGPSILEALEAGAAIADGSQDVEQVARRPGQPIKLPGPPRVLRNWAVGVIDDSDHISARWGKHNDVFTVPG
jgi:hypothetical protein